MSKYKLLEDAGLKVNEIYYVTTAGGRDINFYVRADELLRWLESAPVIYIQKDDEVGWDGNERPDATYDTHSARLVCISPIQKDSAESLLRELIKRWAEDDDTAVSVGNLIVERARKLLGEK